MRQTETVNISSYALEIVKQVTPRLAVEEAMRYVARQQVELTRVVRSGKQLSAHVLISALSGEESVEISIFADNSIDYTCSCQVQHLCAHTAAGLLVLIAEHGTASSPRTPASTAEAVPSMPDVDRSRSRSLAGPGSGLSRLQRTQPHLPPPPPPLPAWQRELDRILPGAQRAAQTELCLFLTVLPADRSEHRRFAAPGLSLRPGVRGSRNKWIRGNARWSSLEHLGASRETTRAFLRLRRALELSGLYYWSEHDWIDVLEVAGADLWPALQDLHAAGIPIVSAGKAQHQVEFVPEMAQISGSIVRREHGLEITATLQLGDDQIDERTDDTFWWVGAPSTAFALVADAAGPTEHITLVGLDRPVSGIAAKLLDSAAPLIIPDADLEAFEDQYLPRFLVALPSISPDGSFEMPEAPRSRLRLTARYDEWHTHLSWAWHHPAGLARNAAAEREVLQAVVTAAGDLLPEIWPGQDLSGPPPACKLGRAHSVHFVTDLLPQLRDLDGVEILEEAAPPEYRAAEIAPFVTIRPEATGDWFDLHVTIDIAGETVEFAELFTALALNEPLFVLPSGTYFSLMAPEFDKLREILDEARALTDGSTAAFAHGVRVNRHNVDLWAELSELGIVAAQEADWWRAMKSLAPGTAIAPVATPHGIHATLRDYQEQGLAWLHFLRTHGLGGILADDMGLGKTLQTIAMMEIAREEDPDRAPFLVVAPTSVVSNWASECEKFAPELRVAVIAGMESKRGKPLAEAVGDAHVVLTSYALFRGEAEAYRELEWSGLILDEAQQIKNHASHGHRAARTLGAPFTLVVTGTPLENNLLELWSLASLAAPGLLGNRTKFTEFYRNPIEKDRDAGRLALLQRRLAPFLLRRTKDLVAADLPPKQEQVLEIELHPKHRKQYDLRFQRERQKILGLVGDMESNRFQIFSALTTLRQLALDPELVGAGSAPSAKLDALVDLLTEAADEGHRVLVLSQFTRFLGSARDRTEAAGLASCYLDGSTTNRGDVIAEFRTGDAPVFFVSLKAGGFGLNLVEADYVVLLDPWWNPAVEAQAIDRTHRIGQERPVFVYRLVAANTIERKVIALREAKADLFNRVLDGGTGAPSGLTADDIRDLLA
ncbi:superfamily II DNA or RNA helicase [Leucobacter exalbidus]|uniref:Superfamily II DNA or RNA helicase n=1 Tax=Leucobacter exalbidus TaxID=662960 RepID=A0A940PYK5_9MICO|nr:DEAD/DEAH box helicase [Leucobacter exalbidus]MBP1326516.1 superfamily II DNA or RNA helicase [Leucobacter exalbidus]